MTQPYDPNQPPPYGAPPPPPYGAPPPPYGAPPPQYGYGVSPGQGVNDPAPMGNRLVARIIDWVLEVVVVGIVLAIIGLHVLHQTTNIDGTTSYSFSYGSVLKLALVAQLIIGAYEIGMIAARGATLGKMAMGIRVANIENGRNPSLGAAAIRWLVPAAAGVVFSLLELVVFLSPFFDSTHRNRGWYDYAAKTIAVRTR